MYVPSGLETPLDATRGAGTRCHKEGGRNNISHNTNQDGGGNGWMVGLCRCDIIVMSHNSRATEVSANMSFFRLENILGLPKVTKPC